MAKLVGLVRPLTGYMSLAVLLGLLGHLCATAITVLGGFALLRVLGMEQHLPLSVLFLLIGPLCPAAGRTALWGTDLQPLYRLQAAGPAAGIASFDVLRRLSPRQA